MNTKSSILYNALQSYYLKLLTDEYDIDHEKDLVAELLNYVHDNEITEQWLKHYIRIINKSIKHYRNELLTLIEDDKAANDLEKLSQHRAELNKLNNYFLNK